MNDNSTYPNEMRHPGGVLDRSGKAGLRQPHPVVREPLPPLSPEIPKTVEHPT
jgi:hypothetical protein